MQAPRPQDLNNYISPAEKVTPENLKKTFSVIGRSSPCIIRNGNFLPRRNVPEARNEHSVMFTMTSSTETLNTKHLSRIGSSTSSGGGGVPIGNRNSPTSNQNSNSKVMAERWFLCSQTARTEARLLAILDLISSIVYLIMFGLLTFAIVHHPRLVRKYLDEVPENQDIDRLLTYGRAKQAFFLSVLILRPATSLIIAIILFVGAQKRSYGMVKICFAISIIYIIIDIILFIPKTIYTQNGKIYVITYLVNVVYMLYELWVMYELKKEVREYRDKENDAEPETEDTTVVGEGESAAGEDG